MADPQLWNRYAYGRSDPLRYIDPEGRLVELPQTCAASTGCKEIKDIRNGLPFELRIFVRATKLADGRIVVNKNLLNAVADRAASANFAALRQVANASERIFLTTSLTQHYEYDHQRTPSHAFGHAQVRIAEHRG